MHTARADYPIDASVISKEWLEHVINNIRPRLDGFVIHPIQLSSAPNHFAYVVEIPQSTTAHQAMDKRYYKRFNFEATAMEHYEIQDVMARNQHPKLELQFEIRPKYTPDQAGSQIDNHLVLTATIHNSGVVFAEYINSFIHVPKQLLGGPMRTGLREFKNKEGVVYSQFAANNLKPDSERYGILLPDVSRQWFEIKLRNYDVEVAGNLELIWRVHADNAAPIQVVELFRHLPFISLDPPNDSGYLET